MKFLKDYGWLLLIVVIVGAYFIFKSKIDGMIASLQSAKRSIEDKVDQASQQQPLNQTIVVPVNPPHPKNPSCDALKAKIDAVKAKISAATNPYIKASLEKLLAALDARYAGMNCVGPPPPPGQQA